VADDVSASDRLHRSEIEAAAERAVIEASDSLPFDALRAPQPVPASPPTTARWLGFAAIVVGGILGGAIGWGIGDVLGQTDLWAAIGALVGAVSCAIGVGIVATLTLRAMNEWNAVHHPEADEPHGIIGDPSSTEMPGGKTDDNATD
jgi:hypothetical protein